MKVHFKNEPIKSINRNWYCRQNTGR